jgi:hypothetical protein
MKVVGIDPSPRSVSIAFLEALPAGVACQFHETWDIAPGDRLGSYVTIRKRLVEKLQLWAPQNVCVTAFEPITIKLGRPKTTWFKTAEVRGVVAEAARSLGKGVELRPRNTVKRCMDKGKVADLLVDDAFWATALTSQIPKTYRQAALLALSRIRQG